MGLSGQQVRVLKEGTQRHPKWHAHVFHAVSVACVPPPAATGVLGVDRDVEQATDSDGHVYALPDTSGLDANIRCKQRKADQGRERSRRNGQLLFRRARRLCS